MVLKINLGSRFSFIKLRLFLESRLKCIIFAAFECILDVKCYHRKQFRVLKGIKFNIINNLHAEYQNTFITLCRCKCCPKCYTLKDFHFLWPSQFRILQLEWILSSIQSSKSRKKLDKSPSIQTDIVFIQATIWRRKTHFLPTLLPNCLVNKTERAFYLLGAMLTFHIPSQQPA